MKILAHIYPVNVNTNKNASYSKYLSDVNTHDISLGEGLMLKDIKNLRKWMIYQYV